MHVGAEPARGPGDASCFRGDSEADLERLVVGLGVGWSPCAWNCPAHPWVKQTVGQRDETQDASLCCTIRPKPVLPPHAHPSAEDTLEMEQREQLPKAGPHHTVAFPSLFPQRIGLIFTPSWMRKLIKNSAQCLVDGCRVGGRGPGGRRGLKSHCHQASFSSPKRSARAYVCFQQKRECFWILYACLCAKSLQ